MPARVSVCSPAGLQDWRHAPSPTPYLEIEALCSANEVPPKSSGHPCPPTRPPPRYEDEYKRYLWYMGGLEYLGMLAWAFPKYRRPSPIPAEGGACVCVCVLSATCAHLSCCGTASHPSRHARRPSYLINTCPPASSWSCPTHFKERSSPASQDIGLLLSRLSRLHPTNLSSLFDAKLQPPNSDGARHKQANLSAARATPRILRDHVRHVSTTPVRLRGGGSSSCPSQAVFHARHLKRLQQLSKPRRGLDQDLRPGRAPEDTEPHCPAELPYVAHPCSRRVTERED
jgi:hypothetical protein